MKLTKQRLRQIVREEKSRLLNETRDPTMLPAGGSGIAMRSAVGEKLVASFPFASLKKVLGLQRMDRELEFKGTVSDYLRGEVARKLVDIMHDIKNPVHESLRTRTFRPGQQTGPADVVKSKLASLIGPRDISTLGSSLGIHARRVGNRPHPDDKSEAWNLGVEKMIEEKWVNDLLELAESLKEGS